MRKEAKTAANRAYKTDPQGNWTESGNPEFINQIGIREKLSGEEFVRTESVVGRERYMNDRSKFSRSESAACLDHGHGPLMNQLLDAMSYRLVLWTDPTNWTNRMVRIGAPCRDRSVGQGDAPAIEEFLR